MTARPTVLLVCGDLFFATKLRGEIESAGMSVEVEPLADRALAKAPTGTYRVLVLDLELPGLNVPSLLAALPADRRPKVIAFGPHVRKDRLDAARAAGCDEVLSRGQIASSLPQYLAISG